jgi:hypothetical protein
VESLVGLQAIMRHHLLDQAHLLSAYAAELSRVCAEHAMKEVENFSFAELLLYYL